MQAVIWDTISTSLIADSGHFASEAFSKEFVCFTRFPSYHRDLLRVLVRGFSHIPGCCSTSFTNNLEHVPTFSYLDSFYRLDLSLPKRGISKICSHIRASNFTLLLTLGRLKKIYTRVFCFWKGNLIDLHIGDLFWPLWVQDYSTVEQPCVCLLHCCGITLLILPSQETYREETKAMLPHVATKLHGPLLCSSDFLLWVEIFGSLCYSFQLWIHFFIVYSYRLKQSILSGWVLHSKSIVCVFTTILKFKPVFNSVIPKLLQTAREILPRIHKVL